VKLFKKFDQMGGLFADILTMEAQKRRCITFCKGGDTRRHYDQGSTVDQSEYTLITINIHISSIFSVISSWSR